MQNTAKVVASLQPSRINAKNSALMSPAWTK